MEVVMEAVFIVLVIAAAVLIILLMNYITRLRFEKKFRQWQESAIASERKDAIKGSRAVLGGKFTEQMAPYLPDFKYDPTEARFIGSPIDLLVFPGLAKGDPTEIVVMEIKTGNSQLTPQEKKIRELIENGMVRWELIKRAGEG
jgi:predicted Holliday junction resolvase-like endonuclease